MSDYSGLSDGQWYQASDGNWYCWPNPTPYPGPPAAPVAPVAPPAPVPPAVPLSEPAMTYAPLSEPAMTAPALNPLDQRVFAYAQAQPAAASGSWWKLVAACVAFLLLVAGGTAYAIHRQDVNGERTIADQLAAARNAEQAKQAAAKQAAEAKAAAAAAVAKRVEPFLAAIEPEVASVLRPLNAYFEQDVDLEGLLARYGLKILVAELRKTPAPADVKAEAAALLAAADRLERLIGVLIDRNFPNDDAFNLAIADAVVAVGPFFSALRGLYAKAGRSPVPSVRRFLPL